ncbi:Hypothetical protein A7982_09621 [Minicystis rosea]|nr:Hypothetical protein A7982_09621 [Minicystis rosea]
MPIRSSSTRIENGNLAVAHEADSLPPTIAITLLTKPRNRGRIGFIVSR